MSMTQTMNLPTTRIYRNDATGYTVTLTDNGRGSARVTDSLGYDFAMVGSDYPFAALLAESRAGMNGAVEVPTPAARQMASPLAADAQVRSARPLAGPTGNIGEPSLPQARCLAWAARSAVGTVRRGVASVTGATAPYTVLQAMARRRWFTISGDRTMALITDTGKRALAAYVAKHGEVL